jgi:HD-GYP domain-containing protein (c-di-GMP phosphodiesterase class II)
MVMSQTILIEENEELFQLYSINLSTYSGTDIIRRHSAEDATNLLTILPNINLIITRNKIGKEETAKIILNFLQGAQLDIPLIILGDCPEATHQALVLKEPVAWENLIKNATSALGISAEELQKKIRPEYIPVGVYYFYQLTNVPCDIYIRIRKSATEYQFVKRIHSKDHFDSDMIKKYESGGLKEFFVPRDYEQYFVNFVTNQLIQRLEKADLSLEDRIITTSNSFDIVSDQISRIGLEEASIQLSDASINSMAKSVKESPTLAPLLKFLFTSKISFAYQHAHLVTILGHYILSKQSWYEKKHLDVLSFTAFFSDIGLKSVEQIRINSDSELNSSQLPQDEREMVFKHAKTAVQLCRSHPEFDDYREMVMLQHHGKRDGIGFAENPDEEIHPLAKVFIIADAFVKILLTPGAPKAKKDILPLLSQRFTNPSYQKIIKALEAKID